MYGNEGMLFIPDSLVPEGETAESLVASAAEEQRRANVLRRRR